MPVSLHLSDHNPDMNESLERCIEKAMLNLLDECVWWYYDHLSVSYTHLTLPTKRIV